MMRADPIPVYTLIAEIPDEDLRKKLRAALVKYEGELNATLVDVRKQFNIWKETAGILKTALNECRGRKDA